MGLCPIKVARVVADACVAEFGLGSKDVVLVIEFDLREEERRIPDFILKDEDVAQFQFAQRCRAFVEPLYVQYFLEKVYGLIGLLQVKGANVRQVLGNLRRFLGEPQVVQCEFVILSERCNGFPVDRRGLQQRLQAHVERLGSGGEEIRVLWPLGGDVRIALHGRGVVFVARGRLGQLDQAFAGFPKPKVQGLGVHKGVAEIVDLVEVPHQHFREARILRVFAGGP